MVSQHDRLLSAMWFMHADLVAGFLTESIRNPKLCVVGASLTSSRTAVFEFTLIFLLVITTVQTIITNISCLKRCVNVQSLRSTAPVPDSWSITNGSYLF
jgi:hypothetical protein